MSYIILKPDYNILRKYLRFEESKQSMEQLYPNGYPIYTELFNTDESIEALRADFNSILDKYSLQDHCENLLYLALSKRCHFDEIIFNLEEEYYPKKRLQELAQLMLAFKKTNEEHISSLQLKTLTQTVSLKDKSLIAWLGEIIQEAIDEDKLPIGLFSLGNDSLSGTEEQLSKLANERIPKPRLEMKYYIAPFCFFLHPYLVGETSIRPSHNVNFSDAELNFYFDLLVLLKILDPNTINSEPKDYVRTIVRNNLTPLNT